MSERKSNDSFGAEFFSARRGIIPSRFPSSLNFPRRAKREQNRDVDHIFNTTVDTRGACVHLSMRRSGPCNLKGEGGPGCRRGRRGGLKACLSYWRLSVLASGARNTCSDFAVNRRLNRSIASIDPTAPVTPAPDSSRRRVEVTKKKKKKKKREKRGKKKESLPTSKREK